MPTDWNNTPPVSLPVPSATWNNGSPGSVATPTLSWSDQVPGALAGVVSDHDNVPPGSLTQDVDFGRIDPLPFTLTGSGETEINGLYVYARVELNGKPVFMQLGHDRNEFGLPNGTRWIWNGLEWSLTWVSQGGGSAHESLVSDGDAHPLDGTISLGFGGSNPLPTAEYASYFPDVAVPAATFLNGAPGSVVASENHDDTPPGSLTTPTSGFVNTTPGSLAIGNDWNNESADEQVEALGLCFLRDGNGNPITTGSNNIPLSVPCPDHSGPDWDNTPPQSVNI